MKSIAAVLTLSYLLGTAAVAAAPHHAKGHGPQVALDGDDDGSITPPTPVTGGG